MTENQLSTEYTQRIMILEESVCSPGTYPRRFTFEPPGLFDYQPIDPYYPELGHKPIPVSRWQVTLGNRGLLVLEHRSNLLNKALFKEPNFIELFKDFDGVKAQLTEQGVSPTEPVLCWLRGLIHAFMAENPNVIQCEATLKATSGVR